MQLDPSIEIIGVRGHCTDKFPFKAELMTAFIPRIRPDLMLSNLYDDLLELCHQYGIGIGDLRTAIVVEAGRGPVSIGMRRFVELAKRTIYNADYGGRGLCDIRLIGRGFMIYLHEYDGLEEWRYMSLKAKKGDVDDHHLPYYRDYFGGFDAEGDQWHRRTYTVEQVRDFVEPVAKEFEVYFVDLICEESYEDGTELDRVILTYSKDDNRGHWDDKEPFETALIKVFGINVAFIPQSCMEYKRIKSRNQKIRIYDSGDRTV